MEEKNEKPKIRFGGFTDVWEQRKLGDFVEFYSGLTYSPHNIVSDGVLVLRSSNVKNGAIVDADNVYVQNAAATSDMIRNGDVIVVVRNGSRNLIGKHAQIKRLMPDTVIGAFMTGIRSDTPEFTNTLLDSQQFNKEIEKNLGATINQITTGEFKKMLFYVPQKNEKIQIGTFFTSLDNLITLHQRKYDKLINIKKSMLEKMFPKNGQDVPEIRFKGFTDDWKQRKLRDSIKTLTGGTSIEPNDYQDKGVRTIPKGAMNSSGIADLSGSKFISDYFYSKSIKSKVSTNNIVTSLRDLVPSAPNMGRIVRIIGEPENFLMPQGVYKIELHHGADEDFVIAYSNSEQYRKIIYAEKSGSTQVHIRNGEFLNINLPTPSEKEEQKQIGVFFKTLDTLITLHQRKLEKLKNIKKSCLERMFI